MSMQAILAASQSMSRMQTMQSARTKLDGTANVLLIESKQNGGDEKKEAKAEKMEERSNDVMSDLMEEVSDVNKTLKPDDEVKAEEASNEPEKDTLVLSDSAARYLDGESLVKAAVGEAVTYKADGSIAPNASAKTEPAFKATA